MTNKYKSIFISLTVALLLIIVVIFLIVNSNDDQLKSEIKSSDKELLVGYWLRTDADYIIKINSVNDIGTIEAQYFNPKSINVGSALWENNHGNLKIYIELRDVNYPGSNYTLNYLPDRDILAGEYYQAVDKLTFYVEFERNN